MASRRVQDGPKSLPSRGFVLFLFKNRPKGHPATPPDPPCTPPWAVGGDQSPLIEAFCPGPRASFSLRFCGFSFEVPGFSSRLWGFSSQGLGFSSRFWALALKSWASALRVKRSSKVGGFSPPLCV